MFLLVVLKAKSKTRYDISLRFTVTQDNALGGGEPRLRSSLEEEAPLGSGAGDLVLLNGLINYLGCGRCNLSRNEATFIISKFDISNKIIPLFNKYPLLNKI